MDNDFKSPGLEALIKREFVALRPRLLGPCKGKSKKITAKEKVIKALKSGKYRSVKEISLSLDVCQTTVRRYKRELGVTLEVDHSHR